MGSSSAALQAYYYKEAYLSRQYIYHEISLTALRPYLKNPELLYRRPKLEYIIRSQELLRRQRQKPFISAQAPYSSAELLGFLCSLHEAMPHERHFRTAYRLAFY